MQGTRIGCSLHKYYNMELGVGGFMKKNPMSKRHGKGG